MDKEQEELISKEIIIIFDRFSSQKVDVSLALSILGVALAQMSVICNMSRTNLLEKINEIYDQIEVVEE